MKSSAQYDIAVIGGGIVGMATAMALSDSKGIRLIVLEAEDRLAAHQTGNNSGVIHSGLYYKPGSLKARNCVEGRKALYRFCEERGIACVPCGKVVVAGSEEQLAALDWLELRGRANGLKGLERLGPEALCEREPHVKGVAGLWVPETGIVDFVQVVQAFADLVQERGGEILTQARLNGLHSDPQGLILETSRGEIRTRHLINCAGLQSDRVARMCGCDPGVRIIPFRGEYHALAKDRAHLVRNLIYPVPDPRFPFLGAHFTRRIHGGVEAGPNAVLAFKREGYGRSDFSLRDTLEIASFPGFWRMAAKYWRTGFGEFYRSFSKPASVKALRALVPDLCMEDLQPGGTGVRAQAVDGSGRLLDDFRIEEGNRAIHVLNAPSPAATASISIGQAIARIAERNFDLDG